MDQKRISGLTGENRAHAVRSGSRGTDRGLLGKTNGETAERCVGDLLYLDFPCLSDTGAVRCAFSTRKGGVSSGIFSTMNFSFTRGDDPANVSENFRRIAAAAGFDPDSFVAGKQTHTSNIHIVTEEDRGNGVTKPQAYHDIDGLVTDVPGLTLVTVHADCPPVYLVDPVRRAIGLVHAGWRGTAAGIAPKAVRILREQYGSLPEDVLALVGPGICRKCYEVAGECAETFARLFSGEERERVLSSPHEGADGRMHWQLDLAEANRLLLLSAGVRPEHIHTSGVCTHCNSDFLFSHRTMGEKRGLNAAFLSLLP